MLVVAFAGLVLLTSIIRLLMGSWFAPAAFFGLYWTLAVAAALILAPHYEVAAEAVVWVFVSVVSVAVGAMAVGRPTRKAIRAQHSHVAPHRVVLHLRALTVGAACLGLSADFIALLRSGYSLSVVVSPESLVAMANEFSVGRYSGTYSLPLESRALLTFVYAAPLFGGMLSTSSAQRRDLVISVASLGPALLMMVTHTTRAPLIMAGTLWLSAYIVGRLRSGRGISLSLRQVLLILPAGALAFLLFALAGLARLGTLDGDVFGSVVLPKVYSGTLSYLSTFSSWFDTSWYGSFEPSIDVTTFAGVFDLVGLQERAPGLFTEIHSLSDGRTSNIYTLHRPIIEDFTPAGAIAAFAILGAAASFSYGHVVMGGRRHVLMLTIFYATVIYSVITSIWIYNSILAAVLVFSVANPSALRLAKHSSTQTRESLSRTAVLAHNAVRINISGPARQ